MNMHSTELMRQHQAHKERQARFAKAVAKAQRKEQDLPKLIYINPIAAKPQLPKCLTAPLAKHLSNIRTPEWKRKAIQYDAHVKKWRFETGQMHMTCKDYIRLRSVELGSDYETVIGPCRIKKVTRVRHLIMWEIKTKVKPGISYPELGRLFGGRDQTSALFCVKKIEGNLTKSKEYDENVVSA